MISPNYSTCSPMAQLKTVRFVAEEGELVTYRLLPETRVLGPKFGQRFPLVRRALNEVDSGKAVALLHAGQALKLTLIDGSQAILAPDEVLIQSQAREGFGVAGEGGLVVALDTTITPKLELEGLAREVVRRVQELRKQADYVLTDRVAVRYRTEGKLRDALATYGTPLPTKSSQTAWNPRRHPRGCKPWRRSRRFAITLAVRRSVM